MKYKMIAFLWNATKFIMIIYTDMIPNGIENNVRTVHYCGVKL